MRSDPPEPEAGVRCTETVAVALGKLLVSKQKSSALRVTGRNASDIHVEVLRNTKASLHRHLEALSVQPNLDTQQQNAASQRKRKKSRARRSIHQRGSRSTAKNSTPSADSPDSTLFAGMEALVEQLHDSRRQILEMNDALITMVLSDTEASNLVRSVVGAIRHNYCRGPTSHSRRAPRRQGMVDEREGDSIPSTGGSNVLEPKSPLVPFSWEKGKQASPFGATQQYPPLMCLQEAQPLLYDRVLQGAEAESFDALLGDGGASPKQSRLSRSRCDFDPNLISGYAVSCLMRHRMNDCEVFWDACQLELHPLTRTLSCYLLFADMWRSASRQASNKAPQAGIQRRAQLFDEQIFVLLLLSYCDDIHKTSLEAGPVQAVCKVLRDKLLPFCASISLASGENLAALLDWRAKDTKLDDFVYVREGVLMRVFRSFVTSGIEAKATQEDDGAFDPAEDGVPQTSASLSHDGFLRLARYFSFYPTCISSFALAKIIKMVTKSTADAPCSLSFSEFVDALVLVANSVYSKFEMIVAANLPSDPNPKERVEAFFKHFVEEHYSLLTGHTYETDIDPHILEQPVVRGVIPTQGFQGDVLKLTGQDFCTKRGVKVMFVDKQRFASCLRRQEKRRAAELAAALTEDEDDELLEDDATDQGASEHANEGEDESSDEETDSETVGHCHRILPDCVFCRAPNLTHADLLQREYVVMTFVSPLIADLEEREESRIGGHVNALASLRKAAVVCEIRATWEKHLLVSNNRIWVTPTMPNFRKFSYQKLLARVVFGKDTYKELLLLFDAYSTSQAMIIAGWRELCRDLGITPPQRIFTQCSVDLRVPGSKSYEKALRAVDMISALLLLICTSTHEERVLWGLGERASAPGLCVERPSNAHQLCVEDASSKRSSCLGASMFCARPRKARPSGVLDPAKDLLWPLVTHVGDADQPQQPAPPAKAGPAPHRRSRKVSFFMFSDDDQKPRDSKSSPADRTHTPGAGSRAAEASVAQTLEKELLRLVSPLVARIKEDSIRAKTEYNAPAMAVPTGVDAHGNPRHYVYQAAAVRQHMRVGIHSEEKETLQEVVDTVAREVHEYDILVGPRWVGTLTCKDGDPAFEPCTPDRAVRVHITELIAPFGAVDLQRVLDKLLQFGYVHVPSHSGLQAGHRSSSVITRCWELHSGAKSLGFVWEYPGTITCRDWVAIRPSVEHPSLTMHLAHLKVSSLMFLRLYSVFRVLPAPAALRYKLMTEGITISTVLP